jgi:spore germination cell wall hydrolase CwlJ-like protein
MLKQPVILIAAVVALASCGAAAAGGERRAASAADRDCVARAMYFESVKTAEDGMLAVGTVVMNRLKSGRYGSSICGIVGQHRQFAPGVLSRRMVGRPAERARRMADAVLAGERHPAARGAMFFHAAGLRFRYSNMHYVLVSGGNAFYEKRPADTAASARSNALSMARAFAASKSAASAAGPIVAAALDPARNAVDAVRSATLDLIVRAHAAFDRPRVPPPDAATAPAGALAYSGPAFEPESGSALAAVAALKPKAGPRVVSPSAPVLASAMPAPAAAPAPVSAASLEANALVRLAWGVFN